MIPARHPLRPRDSRVTFQNPHTVSFPDRPRARGTQNYRRHGPWNRERDPALRHFPFRSAPLRCTPTQAAALSVPIWRVRRTAGAAGRTRCTGRCKFEQPGGNAAWSEAIPPHAVIPAWRSAFTFQWTRPAPLRGDLATRLRAS